MSKPVCYHWVVHSSVKLNKTEDAKLEVIKLSSCGPCPIDPTVGFN